jgi:hypothetical protein
MKKVATQEVATSEVQPEIRVIKTATCKSLSGKSDLTYHLGVDDESSLHLRVFANSSSGYFNREWVPYSAIQPILANSPFITSFSLSSLYVGKSTNSPGFLLAALKAEGLVKLKGEKERVYVALDSSLFMAGVTVLMEATDAGKKPKKASKAEVSPLENKSACQST